MGTEPQPVPHLLTGNEAVAMAAMEAGLTFFAGYPITPSSEIAETLANLLPKQGGFFLQMEDEIAAMSAVIGASLAGARALTATSGPGFSLKQEAIGYACGAEIPCVVVNVMRGGPSTGMPTLPAQGDVMQARWGTHGDHPTIALYPERVAEAWELTIRAFNLAEQLRTPVILLMDEIVAHVTEKVFLPMAGVESRASNRRTEQSFDDFRPYCFEGRLPPPLPPYGLGYRYHVTGLNHDETGFPINDPEIASRGIRWLHDKVDRNREMLIQVDTFQVEDADVVVFAYGACARSARSAVRDARSRGIKAGLFRPRTIWPFPELELRRDLANVRTVLVAEMNLGQLAHEVQWALRGLPVVVETLQKVGGDPILPSEILDALERS